MEKIKISVGHLYPKQLNLYGDMGNIITLRKRCRWRGIDFEYVEINGEDRIPECDFYFIGGGQDREQKVVLSDLTVSKRDSLYDAVENGVVVLAICGGYQLLGKFYETADGERLDFTGILDFYTGSGDKRLIGNYEFKTDEKIRIIGFENHAGRTFLGDGVRPLGKVIKGFGNNGADKTEGARYKNTFCTYCHGPMLPKNPDFADMLIAKALLRKNDSVELSALDCSLEILARRQVRDLYI